MNSKSEKKISLTKAELAIMQVLWQNTDSGAAQGFSAREINQALPEKHHAGNHAGAAGGKGGGAAAKGR